MKKSKLIELLSSIKGNPDIVLWNGLVGDWMDIGKMEPGDLVKQTLEHYIESVRLEECIDKKDFSHQLSEKDIVELKTYYKKFQYEINEYVTEEDIKSSRYKKKSVVFIDAKVRGETSYDRGGDIAY